MDQDFNRLFKGCKIYNLDSISCYQTWDAPVVIISDGPYGIGGFPGDLHSSSGLAEWYEPHIQAWSEMSTAKTTLWFWNTEIGWATVHPILERYGWEYKTCNIWDKGLSHVAGNVNTRTITKLPVVSEVCVQYTKRPLFRVRNNVFTMKEWLFYEWKRTKLPFSKTNEACNVKNAATRKYFTKCHLWYMPPREAFEKLSKYANTYGDEKGKPYFSLDGKIPITGQEWDMYKAKFKCPMGVTNVWHIPQLSGRERIKNGSKAVHLNQKPLSIIEMLIKMTSDEGDIVWDPFGGLFTSVIASINTKRICLSSERNEEIFEIGKNRLLTHINNLL